MAQRRSDWATAELAKIKIPMPINVTHSCVAKAGGTEWLITAA
jgi:hypothetical protein